MVLVPSYAQQLDAQQWLALRADGFAVAVTTLTSWVSALWELLGDGRLIVENNTRTAEIWKLLRENDELQATTGTLNLLIACATEAAPYIQIADATRDSLSKRELAALSLVDAYLKNLQVNNLMECSQAMTELVKNPSLCVYAPIALGVHRDELSYAQHAFLDACSAVLIENDRSQPSPVSRAEELVSAQSLLFQRTPQDTPTKPTGAVRMALAAGPSATQRIVCNATQHLLEQGFERVVVASPRPATLYDYAAPILTYADVPSSLLARQKVGETDIGRALANLGKMLGTPDMDDPLCAMPLTAVDFAYSPFSSIGHTDAFNADRIHRRDRLTSQNTIITDLAANADGPMQGLIGLLEAGELDAALDLLQAYLDKRFASQPAYREQQSRALEAFRGMCEAGARIPFSELTQLVQEVTLPVSIGQDKTRVLFTTYSEAAQLAPGSVDCMVLAGLNTEDMPIRETEDALITLLNKLGVFTKRDPLSQARETFYGAFEAARKLVVLQRCLNTSQGDPSQPAIVLEELIDCYRTDPRTDQDMNQTLGIPESLMPYTWQLGEQDVLSNAGATQRMLTQHPQPPVGTIDEASKPLIVLPHRYAEGAFAGLDMSPSQIESYLECPYCWLAKRRLRLEGLDEGFSPIERGVFMHDILRKFYLRFQAEVQPKVTADTLEQARQIMSETFESVCTEQPLGRFGSRYVPLTAWEQKEQQAVLPKLLSYLDTETQLLPTFEPREFEWQFANARPLPYAGCNLRGCVDRIDVDARGHAVVIDYKSSLSSEYRLYDARAKEQPASFELPKRLQALVYAKIVRDWFGCQVVGALYVNPLKGTVLGAYDATVIDTQDIPFASKADSEGCRVPHPGFETFDQLIDDCEREIQTHLANLEAGDVSPNPSHEQACRYCPVNLCPERLAPRKL